MHKDRKTFHNQYTDINKQQGYLYCVACWPSAPKDYFCRKQKGGIIPNVFDVLNMPYAAIPLRNDEFVAVHEDNCYYVNKTHYISLIERANKFFFSSVSVALARASTLSSCYGTIMTERGRQV